MDAIDTITKRVVLNGSDFEEVLPNVAVFVKAISEGEFQGLQLVTTAEPGKPLDKDAVC